MVMYLYGKNSVIERIKINPKSIKEIYLQSNVKDGKIITCLKKTTIPIKYVNERELLRIKKADRLQGIVAKVDPYTYTPFEELLKNPEKLSIVFLDRINDPHNLGAIIRILACFGNFALCIPQRHSCEVNETVLHVCSGGDNYVPVSQVSNMSSALLSAKKAGYWVAGTIVDGGMDICKTDLPFPLCLVLGSEGSGIRYGLEKHLDMKITIPMQGAALSFNVAMACGILGYEIVKQRIKTVT